MSNAARDLVTDERGSVSTARVGLWVTLAFLGWYIVSHDKPDAGVLSIGGTALVMFGGWAAGSKFATAWGSLGSVAQGIASSKGYQPNEWATGDPHEGDV